MIDGLKPYPAMKDSGVPWLGEVPEHWEAASVKRHYAIQLGKMLQNRPEGPADAEVAYLKAQHVQWFSVRTASPPKMWASPRDITQFGIAAGDLLVCEGGEGGRSGIVGDIPSGLIIQNALHRVRPHGGCLNGYLQYVMSAVSATGWFDAINNKATIAHFTREKFGALGMPVPSRDEQAAIVRFLDHADRRIRRYIRAKQRLIKLLEEQKQAIIHRAVTRGLDPNVRLQPSGVEWLGDVPEHWEVLRAKRVFHTRHELARPGDVQLSATQAYGVIAQKEFERRIGRKVTRIEKNLDKRRHVEIDDFVISMRSFQGVLERAWEGGCIRSSYVVLKPARPLCVSFFARLFKSRAYIGALQTTADFIRDGQDLNYDNFCAIDLPWPPLEEQGQIAGKLDLLLEDSARDGEKAQREIDLLREYRTHLIADVVTGKLDVREAAARLPQEAEDIEPPDATDGEPDADESADDLDAEAEETAA